MKQKVVSKLCMLNITNLGLSNLIVTVDKRKIVKLGATLLHYQKTTFFQIQGDLIFREFRVLKTTQQRAENMFTLLENNI